VAYLIDTNIILIIAQSNHPMCAESLNALATLRIKKETCYLTHQNLIEFWRSATRPLERNGLGMSLIEAESEIQRLENLFPILPDIPEIYPEWKRIVIEYGVMGVNVHDARLVAVMLANGITHILTFNISDFKRYGNKITPVHPNTL
jgi:predicted nucleic acid-binding protein